MAVIHNAPGIKVNIDEIKQDLLTYLNRVENGETLIIMKTGKPMAEVRPIVFDWIPIFSSGISAVTSVSQKPARSAP
jgi:antitoxin (DNA-binding transcriptional repressor) of toxin-antitoxin stability system